MDNNQGMISCALGCWLVAALGGALASVLLWVSGGWTFMQGAFVGALVFVVAGLLLNWIMCRPMPAAGHAEPGAKDAVTAKAEAAREVAAARSAEAAASASSETTPRPVSAPAAPTVSNSLTPSTALPGEAELAERKGTWKYECDSAAAAPAATKAAAPAAPAPAKKPAKPAATETTPDYDGDGTHEGENEGTKPAVMDGPRGGKADNLKEIKGIGPKLEALCNDMGFYHFDQIAAWTADEVAWVNANLAGFKGRVSRDNWVEQAKILAAGGETEFSKRVEGGDVY